MSGDGSKPISQLIQEAQGGTRGGTSSSPAGLAPLPSRSDGSVPIDQLIQQARGAGSGTQQQAAVAAAKPKVKGILGRITSDLKQGVGGLIHLPLSAASDIRTFNEAIAGPSLTARTNKALNSSTLGRDFNSLLPGHSDVTQLPGESWSDFVARRYPLLGGALIKGPVTLGEHVRHPTQAAKDYSAHPILGPLGDAATLAIFAGPAAKAATAGAEGAASAASAATGTADEAAMAARAARFGQAAKAANAAHSAVENVASAGIRPIIRGVDVPFSDTHLPGLREVASQALTKATAAAGEGRPNVLATLAAKVSPEHHAITGELMGGTADEAAAKAEQTRIAAKVGKILPNPDEYAAHLAVGEGTAAALAKVREATAVAAEAHGAPPEAAAATFDRYVQDRYRGTLTTRAANLAADVVEGKNPELAGRITEALAAGHDLPGGRADRTAAFMAEPAHAYQAGYEPNARAVQGAVDEATKGLPKAQKLAALARARADTAAQAADNAGEGPQGVRSQVRARVLGGVADQADRRVGKLTTAGERAQATAAYALENQPARLKPVLGENRAATQAVTGIANGLRASGLHDAANQVEQAINELPRTVQGLADKGVDAEHFFHVQEGKPAKGAGPTGPYVFKAGSEKLRTGSPVYDRSPAGQMRGAVEKARAEIHEQVADRITKLPFATRLGEGALADARTLEDARARGYVAFNPKMLFDTQGRVRSLSDIEAQLGVEHPTTFVPKPLFDEFRNYFEPRRGQVLGMVVNPANRLYMIGRLALSPAFIVGRVFGHGMLALMGTSDVPQFASNLFEAYRQWKESGPAGERHFPETPQRLLHSNAAEAEYARMVGDIETQRAATRGALGKIGDRVAGSPIGRTSDRLTSLGNKAIAKPFQLAGFMDNIQRTALYLTERSKMAPEQALEASLRAVGEFDRMAPFERDYVRRIIPFWTWHRELTRIAFHLAEDHPLRVAWTLHLGNMSNQPDQSLPEQYQQGVQAGGKVADVGYLNPFNEVPDTFGGGAFGLGRIAGPIPKIVFGQVTGRNPSTNRQFTGPGSFAEQQKNRPMAPGVLHQLAGLFPQKRLLDTLTGRDSVKRYDTGDPKLTAGGKPIPNPASSPLTAISSYFGTPIRSLAELQRQKAASDRAQGRADRNNSKADQRYLKKLKKSGG